MPKFLEHSTTSWKGQRLNHKLSAVDRYDPRVRIVAAVIFAMVVVSLSDFVALFVALLAGVTVAIHARLQVQRTLRRVAAMDTFIIFMIVLLPFTVPGDPLFTIAGITASHQGFEYAIQIGLKANAIVLMLLALVGTMEATTLGHALARLYVPEKFVHLLLFTVRYLEVIGREYKRMRTAMKARAFVPASNWHTWRAVGYLIGMLLVRSLERSERILAAMKCRGYSGKLYLLDDMQIISLDYRFMGIFGAIILLLIGLNML